MLGAFLGSLLWPKLIVAVPLLGSAYWLCIVFFLIWVYRIIPTHGRIEMKHGLPIYGSILAFIVLLNIVVSYKVIDRSSDLLFQRSYSALSLLPMFIPALLWLSVKKIRIVSSLGDEFPKDR